MAYIPPVAQSEESIIDADTWNQDVVDNTTHLASHTVGDKSLGGATAATNLRGYEVGAIVMHIGTPDLTPRWLPLDGTSVGSAGSGSTYAHAQYEDIFTYLWDNLDVFTIQDSAGASSTKGASAAADWGANKRLLLPDTRGRLIAGLNQGSARLYSWGSTAGGTGGSLQHALTSNQNAPHAHELTMSESSTPASGGWVASVTESSPFTSFARVSSSGFGDPHNNVQPTAVLGVFYVYTGRA